MTYEQYLWDEELTLCLDFFKNLESKLAGTYESVGSNRSGAYDQSAYLIPAGTSEQITWHGKPEKSFRVSNHWNWYTNLKNCKDVKYIQCRTNDLPKVRKRIRPGKASKPIKGNCVCLYRNGLYEVVFGEKYDRKTQTWSWIDNTPDAVAAMI